MYICFHSQPMVQLNTAWIVVHKDDGSSRGFGKGSFVINTYPIVSNWIFLTI